jgi:beta-lactamase superfamily II metal-dependent hydrolase
VIGPDGTTLMFDAGSSGNNEGGEELTGYYTALGISNFDYTIISHWHKDHYAGLTELLDQEGFTTSVAYDRGDYLRPTDEERVDEYLAAVAGVRAQPTLGQIIPLGDGATAEIIAINGTTIGGNVTITDDDYQYENASSIGIVVRYGDFDFYVAGDLTSGGHGTLDVESLAAAGVGQVEALMSSHHGSHSSASATVVGLLNPSWVGYSCGDDNSKGYPDERATDRWNSPTACRVTWSTTDGATNPLAGAYTSADGHMVIRSDGVAGFSTERISTGETLNFANWETPGPAAGVGDVAISEVLVDPDESIDAHGEWFELRAVGGGLVDLFGVEISNGASTFTVGSRLLLDFGEQIVVARDGIPGTNGDVFPALCPPWNTFDLDDVAGSLTVYEPGTGTPIDSVQWGAAQVPVTTGVSRERIDALSPFDVANSGDATGSWGGYDLGTPGTLNLIDATPWPTILEAVVAPIIGGQIHLRFTSPFETGPRFALFMFSATNLAPGPGWDLLGVEVLVLPDPVMSAFLQVPGSFGPLDEFGVAEWSLPLANNPAWVGLGLWAQAVTLEYIALHDSFYGRRVSDPLFLLIGQ